MQTKIISFDTANWAPSPLEFSKLMSLIPEADQTRIKRFHFINDQKRALATCLLIRILIKTLLPETELATVFIDRTEHGRPYLKHPPPPAGFDFNASHHGDYCIAIGCTGSRVGIDVMKVELNQSETVDSFLSTFQDFQVTPREWEVINQSTWGPDSSWARLHSFFRLWCLKESYTKALGLGLGLDFKTIEFAMLNPISWKDQDGSTSVIENAVEVSVEGRIQKGWYFHVAYLDQHHPFCVAVESGAAIGRLAEVEAISHLDPSFFV